MSSCIINPTSQEVGDFIYRFGGLNLDLNNQDVYPCVDYADSDYAIFYQPLSQISPISLNQYPYYSIPSLYTPLDTAALEGAGILPVFQAPALSNMGEGVLIGIIDSGIDYTNPLFLNSDGSTRIAELWDQTLPEDTSLLPPGVPDLYPYSGISYGTIFSRQMINEALSSDDPRAVVPSYDPLGHGTLLAALAAGNSLPEQDFSGAAPKADLAVVRLKPAKDYLRRFWLIRPEAAAFQENDIMMGVKYLRVLANRLQRPLVTLIGLGTNSGSHTGTSPLSQVTRSYSGAFGIATVIAAGNETGLAHHYSGSVPPDQDREDVELRVGEEESRRGFVVELWSSDTDLYSVGFISPGGERISRIPALDGSETTIPFLLDNTVLTVNYQLVEAGSGRELIFMRFERPTPGIWRIQVYRSLSSSGRYHLWLPADGFLSEDTVFLKPDPFSTVTSPGTAAAPITVGAVDALNDSLYIHSGRGYPLSGAVKPDLAAPGVNVFGPSSLSGRGLPLSFSSRSGTSLAAAITAGATANLLSWGIVSGNDPSLSEASLKSYLIRGADRNPALTYPNRELGYGTLNLLQTFLRLRE